MNIKKSFEKNKEQIMKFSSINEISDHFEKNLKGFSSVAPNVSQSLMKTAGLAQEFLKSKLPTKQIAFPLSSEHKPSKAEMAKFNEYFNAINNPLEVLKHIKNGTVKNEHLEALSSVYPSLLNTIKIKMAERMDEKSVRNLPYKVKLSLGKVFGLPMNAGMTPNGITNNQMALKKQIQMDTQAKKSQMSVAASKELQTGERIETRVQKLETEKE